MSHDMRKICANFNSHFKGKSSSNLIHAARNGIKKNKTLGFKHETVFQVNYDAIAMLG